MQEYSLHHTPEGLPVTVDLLALAVALEKRGGKRKLAGALRSAWVAGSCLADLRRALEACSTLDALEAAKAPLGPTVVVQVQSALLATAILLYARATATGSGKGERGAIKLDPSKLTQQQQDDHKTLVRLRNSAIGHVDHEQEITGDYWHKAFLFAKKEHRKPWGLGCGNTSIGFHLEAFAILKRQLPVAISIVNGKCRKRLEDATAAANEVKPSNETLLRYQVDPASWFGSMDGARMMLSGDAGDELVGWLPLK